MSSVTFSNIFIYFQYFLLPFRRAYLVHPSRHGVIISKGQHIFRMSQFYNCNSLHLQLPSITIFYFATTLAFIFSDHLIFSEKISVTFAHIRYYFINLHPIFLYTISVI